MDHDARAVRGRGRVRRVAGDLGFGLPEVADVERADRRVLAKLLRTGIDEQAVRSPRRVGAEAGATWRLASRRVHELHERDVRGIRVAVRDGEHPVGVCDRRVGIGRRRRGEARIGCGRGVRHRRDDDEVVVLVAADELAAGDERPEEQEPEERGHRHEPHRVAGVARVQDGAEDLGLATLREDDGRQRLHREHVLVQPGDGADARGTPGEVLVEAAALGGRQREVDRGGGELQERVVRLHRDASVVSRRRRTWTRVRQSRVRVAASVRPIAAAISAPEKPSLLRRSAARGVRAEVRERVDQAVVPLVLEVARLGREVRVGGPFGGPYPDEPPERGGDAPAAAHREVGAHPVQPRPDVVGRPAGPDLAGQAEERLLEEILGDLGIAGGPDEEGEQLLVVVRPGVDDHRVRECRAVGARGIDRLERSVDRFHVDGTLCPAACFGQRRSA